VYFPISTVLSLVTGITDVCRETENLHLLESVKKLKATTDSLEETASKSQTNESLERLERTIKLHSSMLKKHDDILNNRSEWSQKDDRFKDKNDFLKAMQQISTSVSAQVTQLNQSKAFQTQNPTANLCMSQLMKGREQYEHIANKLGEQLRDTRAEGNRPEGTLTDGTQTECTQTENIRTEDTRAEGTQTEDFDGASFAVKDETTGTFEAER
jgi:hypothetical protein